MRGALAANALAHSHNSHDRNRLILSFSVLVWRFSTIVVVIIHHWNRRAFRSMTMGHWWNDETQNWIVRVAKFSFRWQFLLVVSFIRSSDGEKTKFTVKTARRRAKPKIMHNSNILPIQINSKNTKNTQNASCDCFINTFRLRIRFHLIRHSMMPAQPPFQVKLSLTWNKRRNKKWIHFQLEAMKQRNSSIFCSEWRGINIYDEWKLFHCEKWPHRDLCHSVTSSSPLSAMFDHFFFLLLIPVASPKRFSPMKGWFICTGFCVRRNRVGIGRILCEIRRMLDQR